MIKRFLFASQIRSGQEVHFEQRLEKDKDELRSKLKADGILTFALYQFNLQLYVYLESEREVDDFPWTQQLEEVLVERPIAGEMRYSSRLMDIYHSAAPREDDAWRTGNPIEQRIGSIARLKPDMYASYIYYHYQRQEEKPVRENKTYMIGVEDSWIFSYQELPAVYDDSPGQGAFTTRNTPENWREVMLPHFDVWTDTSEEEFIWRKLKLICSESS
ncbi:MAG: hypothetical protein K0R67_2617 [Paenibacillus sp.]|jgi:L-rhamnose mutarotase|nr:hypothetical protein [Paenibacillus sp.]